MGGYSTGEDFKKYLCETAIMKFLMGGGGGGS